MSPSPRATISGQPGPQTAFLRSEADICIYGGAAGGGKTVGLILEPLRHVSRVANFAAVFFRRTTPQITNPGALWDESLNFYPRLGGTPHLGVHEWRWPRASKIKFSHLQFETTVHDWQGAQIALICFDELTHFTAYQFFYMVSRNRSTCGVRPYIRATCNPDADSWVALERFRLRNAAANPQHKQGGQNADPKQRPPRDRFGQNGEKASVDERRQARADGRTGLHEADAAAAILVADDLAHQYRAGGPLATEPEPVQAAQDEQLLEVLREAAQEGEDRIPQDRDLQHAQAAEAVRERAGKPAAERRGHDGDGADRPGGPGRHAPYRNDRGHDVAVQLLIEAVQGPPTPAGEHRPAFPRGQIAQPSQHHVSPDLVIYWAT